MYRIMLSTLSVLFLMTGIAWAQGTAAGGNSDGAKADAVAPAADGASQGAASGQGESWRYKRHQGLWWYWLPTNKWVYWNDGKWVPYDAQSYAQFNASRQPAVTSYPRSGGSSSGGYPANGQWGNWGPVRYNGYGNVQWPYSQRSSGIRQLGPVPAMGGVRSLPGWGGER